ncbi:unnamed protein product [Arabis nemorensis]|uniref:Uncharacterized protein n=1 Tax=Arabis nemorensis TaxID=586526 RepID=A0A565B1Z5_9BRAS|nr:unnamed protein product [Arabis nemorensis]
MFSSFLVSNLVSDLVSDLGYGLGVDRRAVVWVSLMVSSLGSPVWALWPGSPLCAICFSRR